jgi:hypothetical protein
MRFMDGNQDAAGGGDFPGRGIRSYGNSFFSRFHVQRNSSLIIVFAHWYNAEHSPAVIKKYLGIYVLISALCRSIIDTKTFIMYTNIKTLLPFHPTPVIPAKRESIV